MLIKKLLDERDDSALWSQVLRAVARSRATLFFKERIFERVVEGAFFSAADHVRQVAWHDILRLTQAVVAKVNKGSEVHKEELYEAILGSVFSAIERALKNSPGDVESSLVLGWIDILLTGVYPQPAALQLLNL
jgi:hypothetical protein